MTKHIFVTGGVVSSLGKGITAASLGRLLKARGYKVMMQKADPYLNVDPGTMSPFQHGEVFVTEDGKETDLDLGHYERFIDENLTRESNFTTGLIYQSLIQRERAGDFLGGTVQVIPHVTNEIKSRFLRIEEQTQADVVITELGGTIGDIEGQPFVEAMRQFRKEKGAGNTLVIHVSLVPYIAAAPQGPRYNQAHRADTVKTKHQPEHSVPLTIGDMIRAKSALLRRRGLRLREHEVIPLHLRRARSCVSMGSTSLARPPAQGPRLQGHDAEGRPVPQR